MRIQRFITVAVLAGSVALGACSSESLSPDDVHPTTFAASLNSAAIAFENNAAFQSLRVLQGSFPSYLRAAASAATYPERTAAAGHLRSATVLAGEIAAIANGGSDILALFPSDVLGKTLEWDVNLDQYVVGTRSGAPANGVRVLLYTVNPATNQPIEPLQELGSLDLADESNASADRLGVVLRLAGTTVADYDISLTIGTTTATLRAAGFIRRPDGSGQVNFDLSTSVNVQTSTITVNYTFNASDGTQIIVQLTGQSSQAALYFRVARDGNSIEIEGTETALAVDAEIRFNGTPVATVTGDPADPTIAGVNGRQISSSDLLALRGIIERVGDFLSDFADGVFGPAAIVFNSL